MKKDPKNMSLDMIREYVKSFFPNGPDIEMMFKEKEKELGRALTSDDTREIMKEAILKQNEIEKKS